MSQTYPMKAPGSHRPVKGKCGAKLIKSKKKVREDSVLHLVPSEG